MIDQIPKGLGIFWGDLASVCRIYSGYHIAALRNHAEIKMAPPCLSPYNSKNGHDVRLNCECH